MRKSIAPMGRSYAVGGLWLAKHHHVLPRQAISVALQFAGEDHFPLNDFFRSSPATFCAALALSITAPMPKNSWATPS